MNDIVDPIYRLWNGTWVDLRSVEAISEPMWPQIGGAVPTTQMLSYVDVIDVALTVRMCNETLHVSVLPGCEPGILDPPTFLDQNVAYLAMRKRITEDWEKLMVAWRAVKDQEHA